MKKIDINKFVIDHIQQIKPFDPAEPLDSMAEKAGVEPEKIIRLNANENPYGPSPLVKEAIKKLQPNIYPDPEQNVIRTALSNFTDMPKETILCGAGSDELIDLLFRLFCTPKNNVIECDPTFGMYSFCARITGAQIISVPRDNNFEIDINAVKSAINPETRIIFINSPNNPTGNLAKQNDIETLLETGLIVVIDEAYYEFTDKSFAKLVLQHNNLIVLRTMSKWAGLAGLRIGYGLMSSKLAELTMAVKNPYNVSNIAEQSLIISLNHSNDLMKRIDTINAHRDELVDKLNKMTNLKVYPSSANFVLCKVIESGVNELNINLIKEGVFVRLFPSEDLKNCFRVSIGTEDENSYFLEKLIKHIK